jgi:hypothetical protein
MRSNRPCPPRPEIHDEEILMLTRPAPADVLNLLSRAVTDQTRNDTVTAASAGELYLVGQLLALTSRQVRLEPRFIDQEVRAYEALGNLVVNNGTGDTVAISAALTELRDHCAAGPTEGHDAKAYALASEVLCLAIDATFSTPGAARDSMIAALSLRRSNQSEVVGDFTIAGR